MEGNIQKSSTSELTFNSSRQNQLLCKNAQRPECCVQVQRIKSKGAILVIMWTVLVGVSMQNPAYMDFYTPKVFPLIVGCGAVVLVGPIVGLLASIYFGRYRALYASLWMMWFGSVASVSFFVIQSFFSQAETILYYSGFLIAVFMYFAGFVMYLVNAIPFGLDQMPDASTDEIIAFLLWYTWSYCAGLAVAFFESVAITCTHLNSSTISLVGSMLAVVSLSIVLCSIFLQREWLIIEPKGENPLHTFCGVLRFAAKHKVPIRRSAFTYWEDERPSRIDLAKSKYGGFFSNEQVEDVKTCLRMIAVIGTTGILLAVAAMYWRSISDALGSEFSSLSFPYCENWGGYSVVLFALFGIPIYNVLVYSQFRKIVPSSLKRVGLSQTFLILASIFMLASSIIWYVHTSPKACMFAHAGSSHLHLDGIWVSIPLTLSQCAFFFILHSSLLEFVCAQSPYILRGLLVGLVYSVEFSGITIGIGLSFAWSATLQDKAPNNPSCNVWFYVFTTISAVLGCVLWCLVAKWYKKRERDEPEMCRIFAENYYSK